MERLPAKVLEPADVRLLLKHAVGLRYPERNRVMILLSFKAGFRACEIAGLRWPMILSSDHNLSAQIIVSRDIAKGGSARMIPMHDELRRALKALHRASHQPRSGNVITSERGACLSPGSVVNWFSQAYSALGMGGCIRIPVDGPSSPSPRGSWPEQADRCATSKNLPATNR